MNISQLTHFGLISDRALPHNGSKYLSGPAKITYWIKCCRVSDCFVGVKRHHTGTNSGTPQARAQQKR
jgi:hypothetical protein